MFPGQANITGPDEPGPLHEGVDIVGKVMMRLSVVVVVVVVAVMAAAVQADTVTYKVRTPDPFTALTYAGQDDARIIGWNADHAHGADGEILIKNTQETPDGRTAGLVRFDISTMPAGQTITDAKLRLNLESSDTGPFDVDLYKMLTTWVEAEVTWNSASTGVAWGVAGALGAADVAAAVSATTPISSSDAGSYVEWSVTGLVSDWYNAPAGNHGVRVWSDDLLPQHYQWVNFWGDEYGAAPPELEITYVPEPASMCLLAMGGVALLVRRRRRS